MRRDASAQAPKIKVPETEVDDQALWLADWVWLELGKHGVSMAKRTEGVIWAYLYAVEHKQESEFMTTYPSAADVWHAWCTRTGR